MSNIIDNLEYINTIDITEDTTLASINTDSNGQPFSLKKIVIFMRISASSSSTTKVPLKTLVGFDPDEDFSSNVGSTSKGSNGICVMTGKLDTDNPANTAAMMAIEALEEHVENGIRIAICTGSPNNVGYSFSNVPEGVNGFRKLGVCSSDASVYIAAGSQFKFYGVRA